MSRDPVKYYQDLIDRNKVTIANPKTSDAERRELKDENRLLYARIESAERMKQRGVKF